MIGIGLKKCKKNPSGYSGGFFLYVRMFITLNYICVFSFCLPILFYNHTNKIK